MSDHEARNRRLGTILGIGACLAAAGLLLLYLGDGTRLSDTAASGVRREAGPEVTRLEAAPESGADRTPLPSHGGFYTAPIGSELTFRITVDARSRIQMAMEDQPVGQELDTILRGHMRVLVIARRGNELITQLLFDRVSASYGIAGGLERSPVLEQAIGRPTQVRMRDDGSVLGFLFDDKTNAYAKNLIRGVVCGFRFVIPRNAGRAWEREESDPTGIATVRYEWTTSARRDGKRVRRTKTRYRALAGHENDLDVGYVVGGSGVAELDRSVGWLRDAKIRETLHAKTENAPVRVSTEYAADLELTHHKMRNLGELPEAGWDDTWAAVEGVEDTRAIAISNERELWQLEVGDATLASLLAEIQALVAAEPLDSAALTAASHKLALLIRLESKTLEELAGMVPVAEPFVADVLLGAVGAANTDPAQNMLAAVAGDGKGSQQLRQSALDSMIQLAAPNDAALDSVRNLVNDESAPPGLRDNSLLILGALGSREPGSKSTDRAAVVASLIAYEDRARDGGRLEHWLHALGNTGHDNVMPTLQRYLAHEETPVRHAATSALGDIKSARATAALLDRARQESDPRVRAVAVRSLASRPDAGALDYVGRVLAEDRNESIRRAAVDGLCTQFLVNNSVRPILERVAAGDASSELRKLAASTCRRQEPPR